MPVWDHFATYKEIKQVFSEGRVQLGRRPAKTGVEFARAVITMGVERGISEFQRFGILKRKGKAYLFINMGKVHVKDEPMASLLDELDQWYEPIIKKSKEKNAPSSLLLRVRSLDNAIMVFCASVTKGSLLRVLIEIGKLESHISGYDDYKPLQKLSTRWLTECYDHSAEFRLAASMGSIKDKDIGSIRNNLESVVETTGYWKCKKDSVSFVWNKGDDTIRNMRRVLQRRGLDGRMCSLGRIPIRGAISARTGDVNAFLNGEVDTTKIGDLVLPLSMISTTSQTEYPWKNQLDPAGEIPMPEAYAVIKMIYPPQLNESIPYDMSVLANLNAGKTDKAYSQASYILHAHGLSTHRYSEKTGNPKTATISDAVKKHLAASLLFPISDKDRSKMQRLIIKQD